MLTIGRLIEILDRMPELRVLLVGDLFLDRYLEIDRSLAEVSLETGLEAHQVTEVRSSPGAGGNVIANLRALGVQVSVVSIIGDDGEGYVLRRHLADLQVDMTGLVVAPDRVTPTYTKPMMHEPDGTVHELSRLDICNRTPTPPHLEQAAAEALRKLLPDAGGILVADQVSAPEVGTVTTRLREALTESARSHPHKPYMVDSRMRVRHFQHFMLKPNAAEALRALGKEALGTIPLEQAGAAGMALA
ncbi:MAG: bifunctional heptose 7-phosphate kinase/heptose 1-phosphate adenyltransferase, partial [Anaerolineae bacterium]